MSKEKSYCIGISNLQDVADKVADGGIKGPAKRVNYCQICGRTWESDPERGRPKACRFCRSVRWDDVEGSKKVCKRCGHEWIARSDAPVRCPSCLSKIWDVPEVVVECSRCDIAWKDPFGPGDSIWCPNCGTIPKADAKVLRKTKRFLENSAGETSISRMMLTEQMLRDMWQADGAKRVMILMINGMPQEESEMIVRFDGGESAVDIAIDMGVRL